MMITALYFPGEVMPNQLKNQLYTSKFTITHLRAGAGFLGSSHTLRSLQRDLKGLVEKKMLAVEGATNPRVYRLND